jgi:hypothetical protein
MVARMGGNFERRTAMREKSSLTARTSELWCGVSGAGDGERRSQAAGVSRPGPPESAEQAPAAAYRFMTVAAAGIRVEPRSPRP